MNNELIGTITNNNPDITTDVETSNIEGELNTTVVDYGVAVNKPKINNVTLTGNKSLEDLGINIPTKVSDLQNDSGYITSYTETDPVFSASASANITTSDINNWNSKTSFSGDYNDLMNKPEIPTKVSELTNDIGYISQIKTINNQSLIGTGNIDIQGGGSSDYSDLKNKPSINNITLNGNKSLNDLGVQPAGDYALNSAIPTKVSQLTNDSGYITSYSETDPVFTASVAHGITSTDITNWNNKSTFSGDYNDLTNKPTIPTVPTNVSAFTNDAGYLTTHQDISGKLDTSKVKTSTSTTSGDVYDVTYINSALGDIESLLGGI